MTGILKKSLSDTELHSAEAKKLINIMKKCKTGNNRISKVVEMFPKKIEYCAHKTWSLGGTTADSAIIKLLDNKYAIITIIVANADCKQVKREKFIADIAANILNNNIYNVSKYDDENTYLSCQIK